LKENLFGLNIVIAILRCHENVIHNFLVF